VIDFFSRWIVAFDVVPTVHTGSIKAIYQAGLTTKGFPFTVRASPSAQNGSGLAQYIGGDPRVF